MYRYHLPRRGSGLEMSPCLSTAEQAPSDIPGHLGSLQEGLDRLCRSMKEEVLLKVESSLSLETAARIRLEDLIPKFERQISAMEDAVKLEHQTSSRHDQCMSLLAAC